MNERLSNDALSSTKGTIHQMYVAVEKCFALLPNQRIVIERYGDVTVTNSQQIEVKQYADALTDNHPNFWSTLKNWMNEDFDETLYAALILCTTQAFGEETRLKKWNESSVDIRLQILREIRNDSEQREAARLKNSESKKEGTPQSLKTERWVLDSTRNEKLRRVLERFTIADCSPLSNELYQNIKAIHCRGILQGKRDDFLASLLGFIISPRTVDINTWEIGYDEFTARVQELTTQFCKGTKRFPTKYISIGNAVLPEEARAKAEQLFVRKIREIEHGTAIAAAIANYLYASNTALQEFRAYEVFPRDYEIFMDNVLDLLSSGFQKAMRNVRDIVKDSQNFYDETMMSPVPPFPGFDTPPHRFRNGVIHMHCDDDQKQLKWRLE
jgi:hypothetical protein